MKIIPKLFIGMVALCVIVCLHIFGLTDFVRSLNPLVEAAEPGAENSIVITDLSGSDQTNRPFTISRVFKEGEIANFPRAIVDGDPLATQADVKTRWSDGSAQHVMVSFLADVPSDGSIEVSFQNQSSGYNTGYLDKEGMLDFNDGEWGAAIEINDAAASADVREMISGWDGTETDLGIRYWLKGPIVTQVIVEDRSSAHTYDIGTDENKSLHPIFVVTFYPGSDLGPKVEFILENTWTTKLQDQTYSLALKTGSEGETTAYSKSSFTHIPKSRWRKIYWSGDAPTGWTDYGNPGVNIDYNLQYMEESKILPSYDMTKEVSDSVITTSVDAFNDGDRGEIASEYTLGGSFYNGNWLKYFPTTGGRPDLGVLPTWNVRYLLTFDPRLYDLLVANGGVSGHVPIHYRESATGKYFDGADTVDAFGRTLSVDARPTVQAHSLSSSATVAADRITAIGTVSTQNWSPEMAHQGNFAFLPYLITGDWYFLEELYSWSSYNITINHPANVSYGRNGSWGLVWAVGVVRATAWGMRTLGETAFLAPDGSPEKNYYTEKLTNTIKFFEGWLNITDGNYYDPDCGVPSYNANNTTIWCWARKTSLSDDPNPLHMFEKSPGLTEGLDTDKTAAGTSTWMVNYFNIVMGHLKELFPGEATPMHETMMLNLLHQLRDPDFNPYLAGSYRMPSRQLVTGLFMDSWAAVKDAYLDPDVTSFSDSDNPASGFSHIARAAASFLPGIDEGELSGQEAWDWINHSDQNISNQSGLNDTPTWALVPRVAVDTSVASTLNDSAPSIPSELEAEAVSETEINLSWDASSDDVSILGYKIFRDGVEIAATSSTSYSDTGLSQGVEYEYTVSAYDEVINESSQSSAVSITIGDEGAGEDDDDDEEDEDEQGSNQNDSVGSSSGGSSGRSDSRRSSVNIFTNNITSSVSPSSSGGSGSVTKNVALGARSADVLTVQNFLIKNGYLTSDNATGYFGYSTQAAVEKLQKDYNIVSAGDPNSTGFGAVGPTTRLLINSLITPDSASTPAASPFINSARLITNNISFGARSENVLILQNFLIKQGYLSVDNNTGYFGYSTQSAVQEFQMVNGIISSGDPDSTGFGAVGPTTRAVINIFLESQ